jgi:hypothetical protein
MEESRFSVYNFDTELVGECEGGAVNCEGWRMWGYYMVDSWLDSESDQAQDFLHLVVNLEAPKNLENDSMFGFLLGVEIKNSGDTESFTAYNVPND